MYSYSQATGLLTSLNANLVADGSVSAISRVWSGSPVILSTADGQYALGLVAMKANGSTPGYPVQTTNFRVANNPNVDMSNPNVQFSYPSGVPAGVLKYKIYFFVGSLYEVQNKLQLHAGTISQ